MGRRFKRAGLALLVIAAFVIIGITLEKEIGLPFATFYRVGCAAISVFFIWKLRSDYPHERWPWISLWVASLVNLSIFFTPLVDRPASRGEIMLFALPDAIIVLVARIASYDVVDDHQRAMRQQMVLGVTVAIVFCAFLYTAVLMPKFAR